jgi:hypothetical protein
MNRQEIQERFEKDNLTAVRAKLPASPHYPDPDYYFTATCILLEKLAAVDELHEAAVIAYREDIEALKAKLAAVEDKLRVTEAHLLIVDGSRDQWKEYLVEAEAKLAAVKVYGVAYQHEETGIQGVVDTWQVEQGFFKNNPRLQELGTVFITREALK